MSIKDYRRRLRAWNQGLAESRDLDFLFSLGNGYPQYSAPEAEQAILSLGQRRWVPAYFARLETPGTASRRQLVDLLRHHRYCDSDNDQGREKLLALHWLKGRGARELSAEGDYVAGRYDVASEDLGIVVECGTTRLDKFLKTALSNEWLEFVLVPRGLRVAIVFDFTRKPFDLIRAVGERTRNRAQYLARVCQERRITKRSLGACLAETDNACLEKYQQIAELLNPHASPSFFFS